VDAAPSNAAGQLEAKREFAWMVTLAVASPFIFLFVCLFLQLLQPFFLYEISNPFLPYLGNGRLSDALSPSIFRSRCR
jgi:hypothetical protein